MPEISRFYGVRITMYAADHFPPHFHAQYGQDEALVSIADGAPLKGSLSARAARLVQEWAELHRVELSANWEKSQTGQILVKIAPLP